MNQVDLIQKKRDGFELDDAEISHLISGYAKGSIPDYQMAAFLMAVFFQGMSSSETATLTRLMRDSGTVLDLSGISGFKADKHSTGGVGDKVSLFLAPLLASAGVIVPMISGRALAHTGGTLDKLEAIPGFRTDLSLQEIRAQLEKIGVVMVGQTEDLCPADKKIYALRDATGTVNSLPLITASILSKKLAEGIDALVLDVKAGSGAIFKDQETAVDLARLLVDTASHFGLKTTALLTSMEQPLGFAVGNWLETKEAIDALKGEGPEDFVELTLALASEILLHAGIANSRAASFGLLQEKIRTGEALERFSGIVELQGGDPRVVENPEKYPKADFALEIKSTEDGYLEEINCRQIGILSMAIGAGRHQMSDAVDYTSGIILHKKTGQAVRKNEPLAVAYSNNRDLLSENETRLQQAFKISGQPVQSPELIHSVLDESGDHKWSAP